MKPTGKWGFLPSRKGQLYTWSICYEPKDWWVGLYLDKNNGTDSQRIYLCIVPCFPVVICRLKRPGPR
jgi:hypothetical protein